MKKTFLFALLLAVTTMSWSNSLSIENVKKSVMETTDQKVKIVISDYDFKNIQHESLILDNFKYEYEEETLTCSVSATVGVPGLGNVQVTVTGPCDEVGKALKQLVANLIELML